MVDEGVVDASPCPFDDNGLVNLPSLPSIQTDLLKMRGFRIFQLKKMVATDIMMHISLMTMMMWVWIVGN